MKNQAVLFGLLCAIGSSLIFGLSFLFSKRVTAMVSPLTLLSWRFLIAFLFMNLCAFSGIVKLNLKGRSLTALLWLSILYPVLYFIGETAGISLTSASESAAVIACIPIAVLLASTLILKQPPTKLQVAGISVTAGGIMVMLLMQGMQPTFNALGYALLLGAVVSFALYSVFAQKAAAFTAVDKTYSMLALGATTFTALALLEHVQAGTLQAFVTLPFTNRDFLVAVLYLALGCSVGAFLMQNYAIETIGSTRTASFAGIVPIVAITAGVFVLHEQFTIYQVVGTALVLGGVYLANFVPDRALAEIEEPVPEA